MANANPFSDSNIPIIGGGGSVPAPSYVGLDPGTQGLMNQEAIQAGQSSSYYSGLLNQGVAAQTGQLGGTSAQDQRASAEMGGSAMPGGQIQAIRGVYGRQAQQGLNQLKTQNDYQGQMMKADYMSTVGKALLGQQQNMANYYQSLTNAYVQQETSRAQTINSLFQVGDQVIGMNAKMKPAAQAPNPIQSGGMPYSTPTNYIGQPGGIRSPQPIASNAGYNSDVGGDVYG